MKNESNVWTDNLTGIHHYRKISLDSLDSKAYRQVLGSYFCENNDGNSRYKNICLLTS